jgi:hypothetical protein
MEGVKAFFLKEEWTTSLAWLICEH